ncbi:TraR/DksA family transcriptional regulator [Bacillus sp. NPDC077027]|uniref:TraR/DksA family transcriptional regulator n=1 Tax=Bacillus sp. NPDC077027 TaxID=3390548 RepID=UPI003D06F7BD
MNGDLDTIYMELLQMKDELQTRLFEYASFRSPTENVMMVNQDKKTTLLYHMKEELQDVTLALAKMEQGLYGICEVTGQMMSLEQMRILPTARKIDDFLYQQQYERKALPSYPHEMNDPHHEAFHM